MSTGATSTGAMDIRKFVHEVLTINDAYEAKQFFNHRVMWTVELHPEIEDAAGAVANSIGFCFAEGMSVERRKMWRDVCGAEHPVLGPSYTEDAMTPHDYVEAGVRYAERLMAEEAHNKLPTAWQVVLKDRFD